MVPVWLAHDLIGPPLAIALGAVIGKLLCGTAKAVVQAAAIISVIVIAVALPAVIGRGRSPDPPSALSRDYDRGLLIVLVAIRLAAPTVIGVRQLHALRDHRAQSGSTG